MSGYEVYALYAAVAVSAVSAVASGKQQADIAEINAKQAENQALSIQQQAQLETENHRRRVRQTLSAQRAAIGASGVALEGSPLLALEETASEGEFDALTIRYSSQVGEAQARSRAAAERMQASGFRTNGYMSAASTLLYGGYKASGQFGLDTPGVSQPGPAGGYASLGPEYGV